MCYFFFFKQKTAYEMRISDWSSDVCSSDLTETLCHSVFSRGSPVARSFQRSEVAMRRLATSPLPSPSERISGSAPRLPMRITLFTEPLISNLVLPKGSDHFV